MTLHPDEQARENVAAKFLRVHRLYAHDEKGSIDLIASNDAVDSLMALLAKARLAEAEWWYRKVLTGMGGSCKKRIASLRQAAGERE